MNTLDWLKGYLERIEYFKLYPSRQYVKKWFTADMTDDQKIRHILSDSLVQKHLYGDILSSIDLHADPVEYFDKFINSRNK